MDGTQLIGVGIYSVAEASRLTRIPAVRIRRWMGGYSFQTKGGESSTNALWDRSIEPLGPGVVLSFADMIEARFIDAFRKEGVSWRELKRVIAVGRARFGTSHVFCSRRFYTDGTSIISEVYRAGGGTILKEFTTDQGLMPVIRPFLRDVVIERRGPRCWYPVPHGRRIVIDPARSFGRPIVRREGVPTTILAQSYKVEGSFAAVARWYEVSRDSVRAAVDYEASLVA